MLLYRVYPPFPHILVHTKCKCLLASWVRVRRHRYIIYFRLQYICVAIFVLIAFLIIYFLWSHIHNNSVFVSHAEFQVLLVAVAPFLVWAQAVPGIVIYMSNNFIFLVRMCSYWYYYVIITVHPGSTLLQYHRKSRVRCFVAVFVLLHCIHHVIMVDLLLGFYRPLILEV